MLIINKTTKSKDKKQDISVIGYIRVSSITQSDNTSLDDQRDRIKRFCEDNGYKLIDIIADKDSGTKSSRQGFDEMLSRIDEYDGIVAIKIDRLYRGYRPMIRLLDAIKEHEKFFHTADGTDTRTQAGRMTAEVLGMVAGWERDIMQDRLRRGRERNFKELGKVGGKGKGSFGIPPLGYYYDNGVLKIDHKIVEHIKHIFKMRSQGASFGDVSDYLKTEGIMSPRGNNYSRQAVKNILCNDFYRGISSAGSGVEKWKFEPEMGQDTIISTRLFNAVQRVNKEKARG
ncbi:MAG: recombinase family protein [Candidatus Brocadiales bacterium]|nr:recombinase family protein [Candidatus Brocadiales bacterium]